MSYSIYGLGHNVRFFKNVGTALGWGRERFVRLENGHFASLYNDHFTMAKAFRLLSPHFCGSEFVCEKIVPYGRN